MGTSCNRKSFILVTLCGEEIRLLPFMLSVELSFYHIGGFAQSIPLRLVGKRVPGLTKQLEEMDNII